MNIKVKNLHNFIGYYMVLTRNIVAGEKNFVACRGSCCPKWCRKASALVDGLGRGLSGLTIFLQVDDELVQIFMLN